MNSEKRSLQDGFVQLMDEAFQDVPDFHEQWGRTSYKSRKISIGIVAIAASFVILIVAAIAINLNRSELNSEISLASWEEPSDGLLKFQAQSEDILTWKAPTDILLNNSQYLLTKK